MGAPRSWLRFSAILFLCGGIYLSFVSAQEGGGTRQTPPPPKVKLPIVFENHATPKTIAELREMEAHVQKILKKIMPSVVGVRVGLGQGSGVIVNADGTILTAGHVSGNPNQNAVVILTGGETLKGKTLGRNGGIDSGMMKITAPKTKDGSDRTFAPIEMGNSADLKPGQWVIAIGHPGGFRPNRTPVVRVGRVLFANAFVIRTDCTLVGGDSGGPLFDMQGRVIGIHSRIGGALITENMHVPVDIYRKEWARLAKGESFGGQLGQIQQVQSAGGKLVFDKKDNLTNDDPHDRVQKNCHAKIYTFRMKAGHTYTIDLTSGDRTGKQLDTFLRLENTEGKELAQDDDGAGFPHARIVYKAIRDGDYKVIATSFAPNQTGSFTLKIFDADFVDALVAGKTNVLRSMKLPRPAVTDWADKLAKAKKSLHINAVVIDGKGQPLANKEITFQWEKGTETLKSNGEGVVRWLFQKDKSKNLALSLPAGTRALIALTDQTGASIGLKMKDDPSVVKVKSAGGKTVKTFDGTIARSDPFDAEREKCYRHVREFKMQAGKTYTLDLMSEDFDSYLRIENDEKGKLAEDDDGGGFLNSRIVYTPATDGTYRIVITTCDPGQLGAYRLTIQETDAKGASKK